MNPDRVSPTRSLVLRVCQFRHPGTGTRLALRQWRGEMRSLMGVRRLLLEGLTHIPAPEEGYI